MYPRTGPQTSRIDSVAGLDTMQNPNCIDSVVAGLDSMQNSFWLNRFVGSNLFTRFLCPRLGYAVSHCHSATRYHTRACTHRQNNTCREKLSPLRAVRWLSLSFHTSCSSAFRGVAALAGSALPRERPAHWAPSQCLGCSS